MPERIAIAKLIRREPYYAQLFDDYGSQVEWGDLLRVTNPEDIPLSNNHTSNVLIRYQEGHDECRLIPGNVLVEELCCEAGHSYQPAHPQEESAHR